MKAFFLLALITISAPSLAVQLRPGLWKMDVRMRQGEKVLEPMKELQAHMQKLSPAQKDRLQAQLKDQGMYSAITEQGELQVCYSAEATLKDHALAFKSNQHCQTRVLEDNQLTLRTKFICKNGTYGTAHWALLDDRNYSGAVELNDREGQNSKVDYLMTFVSDQCAPKVKI